MAARISNAAQAQVDNSGSSSDDEAVHAGAIPEDDSIEQILLRRLVNEEPEYLIKFRGVDKTQNAWVAESDLAERAPRLLGQFKERVEEEQAAKEKEKEESDKRGKKRNHDEDTARSNKKRRVENDGKVDNNNDLATFDHGDKVEEIVGARMIDGVLHLYVLWKGKNVCTFVKAEECNKRIPQKVITFYETRLKFENPIKGGGQLTHSFSS